MSFLNNVKEKFNNIAGESSESSKAEMHPRANKSMTIGASKNSEATPAAKQPILDITADACIIRDIILTEDSGNKMLEVIERIENGQLIIVDFSNSSEESRAKQFHVLWGAVMALHGSYKSLDSNENLIIFGNRDNKIAESSCKN